jgi:xylulokinase
VEQNPAEWLQSTCQAIKGALAQIEPSRVQSLSVAGQHPTMVCTDARGDPVRPAILWADWRAEAEWKELSARLGYETKFTILPRLLWLKRHEPERYQQTQWVFQSFDYLSLKFTGHPVFTGGILPPLTLQDLVKSDLDPGKIPSRICRIGDFFGFLTPECARETGLPNATPVLAGTHDAYAAFIGTAMFGKGVACNTVGTTDGVCVVWDQPFNNAAGQLYCVPHVIDGYWLFGGAMSSGAIMLDWFVRRFYDGVPHAFEAATREADSVPAGANGLIALPYLLGERSPHFDPQARGVFFGVSEKHTRAHFARAVMESVAFAVRDVSECLEQAGAEIKEVRLSGGPAHNQVWAQIKADVLGKPVFVPEVADSGLLGSAIVARWGLLKFGTLSEAVEAMVKFHAALEPRPELHALYTRWFEIYRSLYVHLKGDFAKLAGLHRDAEAAASQSQSVR